MFFSGSPVSDASLLSTGQTAVLFTPLLCNLNERRMEIGLMNLIQSSGPPFRFPRIHCQLNGTCWMRGSLWRKGRQGLSEVKLGHPLHAHTHSHNDCQESPVYYCWSCHYPEINRVSMQGRKRREKVGKKKEQKKNEGEE